MAEGENRSRSVEFSDERFKYIGFEVFPGKAGNIFKSDAEKKSLVEKVMKKFNRSEGEVRDRCTLLDERISKLEQGFLTLAAVLMIVSLFLPWFSGYFETTSVKQVMIEVENSAAPADSSAMVAESPASGNVAAQEAASPSAAEVKTPVPAGQELASTAGAETAVQDTTAAAGLAGEETNGYRTVTEVTRERRSLSGLGAIFSLGTYGSLVFSSGLVLIITGILLVVYILCCLGLAGYNLYLLYGVKKTNSDQYALMLKNKLRYNWIPVMIWLAMLVLAFIGASYGFDSRGMIKQVGQSYSVGSFIGVTSVGLYLSLAAFLVVALKGKEI